MDVWRHESLFDEASFDNPLSLPGISPLEKGERSVDSSMKRTGETDAYSFHQTDSERKNIHMYIP